MLNWAPCSLSSLGTGAHMPVPTFKNLLSIWQRAFMLVEEKFMH